MPRLARAIVPNAPHHVVQRGNRRQRTFFKAADYASYLSIAREQFGDAGVEVWAYCLMPNHVHLIATPFDESGLAIAVGRTHLKYSRYINAREGWTGSLWQGRFQSSPMDDAYFQRCVKYVGLNPVRAGLVAAASSWPWSSVQAHLEMRPDRLLTPGPVDALLDRYGDGFFDSDMGQPELDGLRASLRTGRPLAEALRALD